MTKRTTYRAIGTVYGPEKKKDGNGWAWVIGIAVFLIILAAA